MLTIGLGEPPASITGIKALLLEHFGVADRPGSVTPPEPDWIDGSSADAASTTSACSQRWRACRASCSSRRSSARCAYDDAPLPLPHGQTVSQPFMVALICQSPRGSRPGDRVLDVGTGSGYAAAVLAELAGEVHSIERIPELAESARAALAAAGYERVAVHVGDGSLGLPEHAPFAAIAVAAAAIAVPPALWGQLVLGGRIALPLRVARRDQHLCVLERTPGRAAACSRPCRRGSSRS